ncbi:DUF4124 domain-containing protein [Myxococcota bacterium]|nr:DUF4124 domain-containing protein [Myxococcota bacterium]
MSKQHFATRIGRVLIGTCLLIGLAGPAFAGNVYSWITEDGTYAFTDDPKRIPAKHKDEAQARPMGDLKRYGRYTVDRTDKSYTDRLRQRQVDLREQAVAMPQVVVSGQGGGQGAGLTYNMPFNVGRSGGGQRGAGLQLPLVGAGGAAGDEPITVESVRVKPVDGEASRHMTIVKQGDRVISVFKGENRDRTSEPTSESELGF